MNSIVLIDGFVNKKFWWLLKLAIYRELRNRNGSPTYISSQRLAAHTQNLRAKPSAHSLSLRCSPSAPQGPNSKKKERPQAFIWPSGNRRSTMLQCLNQVLRMQLQLFQLYLFQLFFHGEV